MRDPPLWFHGVGVSVSVAGGSGSTAGIERHSVVLLRESRIITVMHTVVETPVFIRSAKQAGVTEEEIDAIKMFLATSPDAGDEMPGTGGARKVRFAGRGKGKSGGYRVITFYSGENIPVFLLDIYAKGEKIDLSQSEKHELKKILTDLVETYRSKDDE